MSLRRRCRPRAIVAGLALGLAASARADSLNGFELTPSEVPPSQILPGGPARDGIPALDDPEHVPASQAHWSADTLVLGVQIDGRARAYPLGILAWHELVNDTLGDRPILVSYCPLCGTGLVFDRRIDGAAREFGVSGLLYRSDMLLYDQETGSLWSQILARAITGAARGTRLRVLRAQQTRWDLWCARHPDTTVLSPRTGHVRDYLKSPYGDYATSAELRFPVPLDTRYHPKMPTLGVRSSTGAARAYPAEEVVRAGGHVDERFEGQRVQVSYDPVRQVFDFTAPPELEVIEGFWFAWAAFHPETSVFTAPDRSRRPDGRRPDPPGPARIGP